MGRPGRVVEMVSPFYIIRDGVGDRVVLDRDRVRLGDWVP